ncbi:hypothetical protein [Streptococcus orisratti]|uniref:hypothetical protein n=1 Tax=Streptococcus orisratti TaxID=114652 RepID=UPI0023542DC1|nr:hypothetical protein [Streptococcus orisratti]
MLRPQKSRKPKSFLKQQRHSAVEIIVLDSDTDVKQGFAALVANKRTAQLAKRSMLEQKLKTKEVPKTNIPSKEQTTILKSSGKRKSKGLTILGQASLFFLFYKGILLMKRRKDVDSYTCLNLLEKHHTNHRQSLS